MKSPTFIDGLRLRTWKRGLARSISAVASFLIISSPIFAQSTWKSFSSKECGYTAKFPGKPKEEFRSLKVENGEVEYRSLSYEGKGYILGITCNAINVTGSSDPEDVLTAARQAAIDKLHPTKGREMRVLVQGHPARLIELSGDGFIGFGELVVANGKFYQILAIVEPSANVNRAKLFLKSFRLFIP